MVNALNLMVQKHAYWGTFFASFETYSIAKYVPIHPQCTSF